ncbi:Na(+)/citrate cotransporter-like [Oratosquilla oratoria]|uniref:Na(+)/citrate cotransporter-like n=1 Tax=Oratosquilla oratoria TaxID=337810 RepID=UPI003F765FC2
MRRPQCPPLLPHWKSFVIVLAPLIFAPVAVIGSTEGRCGYVILLMATFWVTEAMPVAITALLPVVAYPVLGIMDTGQVCFMYMKETNMTLIGSIIVALAIEHCQLHKRIALFVILHVGQSPRRLLAGFMLTTMFLSMWISNTATTAMMTPIVSVVLCELYKGRETKEALELGDLSTSSQDCAEATLSDDAAVSPPMQSQECLVPNADEARERYPQPKAKVEAPKNAPTLDATASGAAAATSDENFRSLRNMCFLGTAYAANLGGTGTMTGCGPNLILMGILERDYTEPSGLNYATWMGYNVPGMILCVALAWLWLQLLYMSFSKKGNALGHTSTETQRAIRDLITRKYEDLGPMSFHESVVLVLFILLVLLWFFREPEIVPGWGQLIQEINGPDMKVGDACPVMLIVILLFLFPSRLNFWCFRDPLDESAPESSPACLTWEVVHQKMPWHLVFLFGGGFAMAEGVQKSGLSTWLGLQLATLDVIPKEVLVFIICFFVAMATEVTSNSATSATILPILKELATAIKVNPLYLMLPATISCSYAFMMPVATPPNAIVYTAANMRGSDLIRAGWFMKMACIVIATIMINTLGMAIFDDIKGVPSWANSTAVLP